MLICIMYVHDNRQIVDFVYRKNCSLNDLNEYFSKNLSSMQLRVNGFFLDGKTWLEGAQLAWMSLELIFLRAWQRTTHALNLHTLTHSKKNKVCQAIFGSGPGQRAMGPNIALSRAGHCPNIAHNRPKIKLNFYMGKLFTCQQERAILAEITVASKIYHVGLYRSKLMHPWQSKLHQKVR